MKKLILISYLFMAALLFSCKKDAAIEPDMGYNYLPGKVGSWIVYDVDSTVYPVAAGADTVFYKYQIKELIESEYTDNEGSPALRIERFRKNYTDGISYDSIPWALIDVYSANKTKSSYEKVEENIRYVKLTFPVKLLATWNGNAKNTQEEWTYKYADIDKKRSNGPYTFDSTCLVVQKDILNLIEKRYYYEVFAKNIGMVSKLIIDVQSQDAGNDPTFYSTPIMDRIQSGVICKFTLNSYGN